MRRIILGNIVRADSSFESTLPVDVWIRERTEIAYAAKESRLSFMFVWTGLSDLLPLSLIGLST